MRCLLHRFRQDAAARTIIAVVGAKQGGRLLATTFGRAARCAAWSAHHSVCVHNQGCVATATLLEYSRVVETRR